MFRNKTSVKISIYADDCVKLELKNNTTTDTMWLDCDASEIVFSGQIKATELNMSSCKWVDKIVGFNNKAGSKIITVTGNTKARAI